MNRISYKKISGQDNCQLKENDKAVLELTYKPQTHIARVETTNERRALIIENEGLLRIKMAVKNEYGVRIGSLTYDNFSDNHGSVEIEGSRFRFIIQSEPKAELHIYKGSKGSKRNLIYSCDLSFDDDHKKEMKSLSALCVIAISWYLYLKGALMEKAIFTGVNIL